MTEGYIYLALAMRPLSGLRFSPCNRQAKTMKRPSFFPPRSIKAGLLFGTARLILRWNDDGNLIRENDVHINSGRRSSQIVREKFDQIVQMRMKRSQFLQRNAGEYFFVTFPLQFFSFRKSHFMKFPLALLARSGRVFSQKLEEKALYALRTRAPNHGSKRSHRPMTLLQGYLKIFIHEYEHAVKALLTALFSCLFDNGIGTKSVGIVNSDC